MREEVESLRRAAEHAQRGAESAQCDSYFARIERQADSRDCSKSVVMSGVPLPPAAASGDSAEAAVLEAARQVLGGMGLNPMESGPRVGNNSVLVEGAKIIKARREGPTLVGVQLGSVADRVKVLRNKRRLSGPMAGVRVRPDLTYAQRYYRKQLLPQAQAAFEEGEDPAARHSIIWQDGYRLFIDGHERFPPDCMAVLRTALQPPTRQNTRPGPSRA